MAKARDLPKDFVLECPLTWRIWLIWGFTLHQERPRCSNSSDRDMVTTATNIAASAWVDERTSLQRWNLLLVNCNHAWSENEIRDTAHRQQQPWRRWEYDVINITVMTYIYGLAHKCCMSSSSLPLSIVRLLYFRVPLIASNLFPWRTLTESLRLRPFSNLNEGKTW